MACLTLTHRFGIALAVTSGITICAVGVLGWALLSAQRMARQMTSIDEPLSEVAYELETDAARLSADVATYRTFRDRGFRRAFEHDRAGFHAHMARYDRLATTPRLRANGRRLRGLVEDLSDAGLRLMDGYERHETLLREITGGFEESEDLLRELEASVAPVGPTRYRERETVIALRSHLGAAGTWFGVGMRTPDRVDPARSDAAMAAAERLMQRLALIAVSRRPRLLVERLRRRVAAIRANLATALALSGAQHLSERRFASGHAAIDELLKAEIQPEIAAARRRTEAALHDTMRTVVRLTIVLAVVIVLAGAALSWWFRRAVQRPMLYLLDGVSALGRGRFDQRVRMEARDEFGVLGRALDEMAGRLRQSLADVRAASRRLDSAQEHERAHIAREIHDELGQQLTALKLGLMRLDESCRRLPSAEWSARITGGCAELLSLVDTCIDTMRRVASGLKPAVLEHLGLAAAVEWQVEEFERRAGIVCELERTGEVPPIDTARVTACFRVLQESLTNVARHSRADHVVVRLAATPEQIVLEVEDNGIGLPPDAFGKGSLGLLGMRERTAAVGGTLTIERVGTAGTRVRMIMPLQESLEEKAGSAGGDLSPAARRMGGFGPSGGDG